MNPPLVTLTGALDHSTKLVYYLYWPKMSSVGWLSRCPSWLHVGENQLLPESVDPDEKLTLES